MPNGNSSPHDATTARTLATDAGLLLRRSAWPAVRVATAPRLLPIWVLAGMMLAVFAAFRIGLLIAFRDAIRGVDARTVALTLLTGLRFDGRVIVVGLLPLLLAAGFAPDRLMRRRWFRRSLAGWSAALLTFTAGCETVGAAFLLHFGSRLNWIAIDHFGHFGELALYIWKSYPVAGLFVAVAVAFTVSYLLFARLLRPCGGGVRAALRRPLVVGLLLPVSLLVGWGRLDVRPLRQDEAYFSQNNVIVQTSLNNLFTLFGAVIYRAGDGEDELERYEFPSARESRRVVAGMLRQGGDEFIRMPGNQMWRRTQTARPRRDLNVVIIIMEGMSGPPVGALGYSPSHTPNLDRLAGEGLFFERMYAVGERTSRGLVGVLSGHPDLGGQTVLKRERAQGRFLTLPGVLRRRGYRTLFVCGCDPDFDNMRRFFRSTGIETFIAQDDMGEQVPTTNWGHPDEVILDAAHEAFRSAAQPFFAAVVTGSNHAPYAIPEGRIDELEVDDEDDPNRILNAYRYADWALGEFFDKARRAEYFDRTLFVLVADHGHRMDPTKLIDVPGYRVPCVFYAPGIIPPHRLDTVASQVDVAPTVLGLLGGQYEHSFLGRDLTRVRRSDGFAMLHQDDRLGFVFGERTLILPAGALPSLFATRTTEMRRVAPEDADPRRVEGMSRRMLSYYKVAWRLYWKGTYRDTRGRGDGG